jgi:hypothetical protein
VRESTEEQGKGFSPEGQRQAIASYAREHGFDLLTLLRSELGIEEGARKRRQLNERRKRLRDLYELGDLDRTEYVSKRDTLDAELDALAPGPSPDLEAPAPYSKTSPNPSIRNAFHRRRGPSAASRGGGVR